MIPGLERLHRIEDFEALLAQSSDTPVVIFKHSDACGTSAEALDALVDHLRDRTPAARYAIVTVQTDRDLSRAIAARLGIRHETPQALVIRHGRVVWNASHFRVTTATLEAALAAQTS
jgi:bacillithiol system protein YtxJ